MSYYKVVRIEFNDDILLRVSAIQRKDTQVIYLPGVFVSPPDWLQTLGCGLCVFETQERAEKFLIDESEQTPGKVMELWECECEEELQPSLFFFIGNDSKPLYIEKINCYRANEITNTQFTWPSHTKFFNKVKLTRRIS